MKGSEAGWGGWRKEPAFGGGFAAASRETPPPPSPFLTSPSLHPCTPPRPPPPQVLLPSKDLLAIPDTTKDQAVAALGGGLAVDEGSAAIGVL